MRFAVKDGCVTLPWLEFTDLVDAGNGGICVLCGGTSEALGGECDGPCPHCDQDGLWDVNEAHGAGRLVILPDRDEHADLWRDVDAYLD
jgi:hypothetical protein